MGRSAHDVVLLGQPTTASINSIKAVMGALSPRMNCVDRHACGLPATAIDLTVESRTAQALFGIDKLLLISVGVPGTALARRTVDITARPRASKDQPPASQI